VKAATFNSSGFDSKRAGYHYRQSWHIQAGRLIADADETIFSRRYIPLQVEKPGVKGGRRSGMSRLIKLAPLPSMAEKIRELDARLTSMPLTAVCE